MNYNIYRMKINFNNEEKMNKLNQYINKKVGGFKKLKII